MSQLREKCSIEDCPYAAELIWFPSDKPKAERPTCSTHWKMLYAKEVIEEYKKRRIAK